MTTVPLSLKAISKQRGGRFVLDDVSLELAPGECHVMLGPSGAGKSTVLKIVLGLLKPDSGEVLIDRRGVGYVPQDNLLFPHLTARENIEFVAKLRGLPKLRRAERTRELSRLIEFDRALLDRYPADLSGGQRQRAALLRATYLDPAVLLLDEPLSALDPVGRRALRLELKSIFEKLGTAVLIVTHDLEEARGFADRVTLLGAGRVVQQGTFDELETNPADPLVTAFLATGGR